MDLPAKVTEDQPIITEGTINEDVSGDISGESVENASDHEQILKSELEKPAEDHATVTVSEVYEENQNNYVSIKEIEEGNGDVEASVVEEEAARTADEVVEDINESEKNISKTFGEYTKVANDIVVETEPEGCLDLLNEGHVSVIEDISVEDVAATAVEEMAEDKNKLNGNEEEHVESETKVELVESEIKDELVGSEIKEELVGNEINNELVESEIKDETVESEIKEELVESDKKEELVESEINDELVESDKKEEEIKVENEWLDILGNGMLRKKVIKVGSEGSVRPVAGQQVCIKTEGTLEDGNKVDIFEEKIFILGDGDVITAWDLCVSTMTEGEMCQLITAPRFGYGTIGREDEFTEIPGDSEITYSLELINIKPGPDIAKLTDEQRLQIGDAKRERGNELFRREDYSQAVYSYSRALKYLEPSTFEGVVILQVKCWNNIAASHLKVQEYVAAKTACDCVLKVDPSNVKALFRKGKVLHVQGEFEEAVEILRKANTLEHDNRLIRREFLAVKAKFDEERQKQRSMYQRMVNGLGDKTETEEDDSYFTWPVILGVAGVALGGIIAAVFFAKH